MRDPDRLVYFREEVGGLVVGGYEREPEPWCVDGDDPSHLQQHAAAARLGPFPAPDRGGTTLVPCLADAEVTQLVNGPEAFTPDGEFILGESEVSGLLRGRRVLRPRHRRRGRQRPGDGRVDRRRRAPDGPVEDGHPSLRRAVPRPRLRARPARTRCTARTTTSRTRTTSARPAGRCACRRRTRGTSASARSWGRRAGGSGSTGTGPTPTAPTRSSVLGAGRARTGRRPS